MTNGEKIKEIFPNIDNRLDAKTGIMIVKWADNTTKFFKTSWWNSEYKEPTTKNDLGIDLISRSEVLNRLASIAKIKAKSDAQKSLMGRCMFMVERMPSITPQVPKCKDCKWWKDSDGEYRRGCGAESQCPINRKEVFEGNGYCFLFEPQERENP